MDTFEAINTRHSVRKYKTGPVDEMTLQKVLDAARMAPSWANTQCWRFVVVSSARTKSELAECLNPGNPATEAIKTAPLVIVACAEMGKAGFYKGEATTDKGDWFMFDVGLAMENLALAAHAVGLGTVHVGRFDAKKVAAILNVPSGFSVVEMMPLGKPDIEPQPTRRKAFNEIVFREKFGNTF